MPATDPGRVPVQPIRVIAWSTGVVALIAVVTAAKLASAIVAPTVVAGLFALTLSPVVAGIERRGVPRPLAAGGVVGLGLFGAAGAGYLLAPSAEEWRLRVPSVIRSVERHLRSIEREIKEGVNGSDSDRLEAAGTIGSGAEEGGGSTTDAVMESGQRLVTDLMLAAPELVATLFYIAFLCFFFLVERVTLRRFALSLPTGWRTRMNLSRAMREMRQTVGWYLLTISLNNLGLGAASAAVFWYFGLPNPILWGVMVGVLNFMPYVGPLVANAIVFAVGLSTFYDIMQAVYPVIALAALNLVEGQAATPMALGRRTRVSPLSVFLALAFGAWLWGPLGALVAAPVLIVAVTVGRRMAGTGRGPAGVRPPRSSAATA